MGLCRRVAESAGLASDASLPLTSHGTLGGLHPCEPQVCPQHCSKGLGKVTRLAPGFPAWALLTLRLGDASVGVGAGCCLSMAGCLAAALVSARLRPVATTACPQLQVKTKMPPDIMNTTAQ